MDAFYWFCTDSYWRGGKLWRRGWSWKKKTDGEMTDTQPSFCLGPTVTDQVTNGNGTEAKAKAWKIFPSLPFNTTSRGACGQRRFVCSSNFLQFWSYRTHLHQTAKRHLTSILVVRPTATSQISILLFIFSPLPFLLPHSQISFKFTKSQQTFLLILSSKYIREIEFLLCVGANSTPLSLYPGENKWIE